MAITKPVAGQSVLASTIGAIIDAIEHLTTGHNHDNVNSRWLYRNIVSFKASDDYYPSSGWELRTGASLSITTSRENSIVRVSVRSTWLTTNDSHVNTLTALGRINRDSNTEIVYLGGYTVTPSSPADGTSHTGFIGGEVLFTGLSKGAHIFNFEASAAYGGPHNNASSNPTKEVFEMIVEEL
jgi:hypothetical protein